MKLPIDMLDAQSLCLLFYIQDSGYSGGLDSIGFIHTLSQYIWELLCRCLAAGGAVSNNDPIYLYGAAQLQDLTPLGICLGSPGPLLCAAPEDLSVPPELCSPCLWF